jgi:hypothetical protein
MEILALAQYLLQMSGEHCADRGPFFGGQVAKFAQQTGVNP